MPIKLKQKQITVQIAELTILIEDEKLIRLLTEAAQADNVEEDEYVLHLLKKHLSDKAETEKAPVALKDTGQTESVGASASTTKPRGTRSSKSKYSGKLSELVTAGDEGVEIALELKNKGLITSEQYAFVLSGEIPKGKEATINQDAQNYIVEELTKAESGDATKKGDEGPGSVVGNG